METGITVSDRLPEPSDLAVATLGASRYPSPLQASRERFVDESNRVLLASDTRELRPYLRGAKLFPTFELAGPRRQVFFDGANLVCGIVTCGGICPGLNNVIRAIVLQLTSPTACGASSASATATPGSTPRTDTNRCTSTPRRWRACTSTAAPCSAPRAARRTSAT
jgi:hypothetical protein